MINAENVHVDIELERRLRVVSGSRDPIEYGCNHEPGRDNARNHPSATINNPEIIPDHKFIGDRDFKIRNFSGWRVDLSGRMEVRGCAHKVETVAKCSASKSPIQQEPGHVGAAKNCACIGLTMLRSGSSRNASTKVFLSEDFLSVCEGPQFATVRGPKRITDFSGGLRVGRGMAIAPEHLLSRTEARRDIGPSSSVRTSGATRGNGATQTW